jgi:hypothetical protein
MSTGQTLQTGHTWNTHDVLNQVDELTDFNLLEADPALAEALQRNGAARHVFRDLIQLVAVDGGVERVCPRRRLERAQQRAHQDNGDGQRDRGGKEPEQHV